MEQNVRLHGRTVKDVASMFQAMDADGSGGLDYEEFKNGLKAMDLVFGPKQLDALIEALDQDGTTNPTPISRVHLFETDSMVVIFIRAESTCVR